MGRRKNGFTLIELSVVTGIIGVIVLLAFPTLANFKERIFLETGATQLVSDLRTTQIKAICLNEERVYDASSVSFPGLTLGGNRQFQFSRTGNPSPGGSGTAWLTGRTGAGRRVIVSSAGRVRSE
ncbi:MAG: type II secretion system protein [Candidatus Margulisbacteria bacterium]|nr:type II secretion system protein [Candidatus Margulisiibacteriota bacterium]